MILTTDGKLVFLSVGQQRIIICTRISNIIEIILSVVLYLCIVNNSLPAVRLYISMLIHKFSDIVHQSLYYSVSP